MPVRMSASPHIETSLPVIAIFFTSKIPIKRYEVDG